MCAKDVFVIFKKSQKFLGSHKEGVVLGLMSCATHHIGVANRRFVDPANRPQVGNQQNKKNKCKKCHFDLDKRF